MEASGPRATTAGPIAELSSLFSTPEEIEAAIAIAQDDPVFRGWLALQDTSWGTFVPRPDDPGNFDEQHSYCHGRDIVAFLCAGNASGKTEASAWKCANFVLHQQPAPRIDTPFWIIAKNYEQVCNVCWKEKLHGHGHIPDCEIDWPRVSYIDVKKGWPSVVPLKPRPGERTNWCLHFKSYEQGRESMQASSIGGFWFSEQFPGDLFIEVFRGCRDYLFPGGQFAEFTPIDPDMCMWVERLIDHTPDGWRFYRCNTECNTALADDWLENFKAAVPDEMMETRLRGSLATFEGVIYQGFHPAIHVAGDGVIDPIGRRNVEHYRGIDWGASEEHPFTCFDDQTEVLTNEGWKPFSSLHGKEQVGTVNMVSHVLEFQLPTHYISRKYSGDLLVSEPKRKGLNFAVTPDHQMVVYLKSNGKWKRRPANELLSLHGRNYAIPIRHNPVNRSVESNDVFSVPRKRLAKSLNPCTRKAFARFLGLWIAEGSLKIGKRNTYVRVSQKDHADEVQFVLDATGWNWNKSKPDRNGVMDFSLCSRTLGEYLQALGCDVYSPDKRIPRVALESWDRDSLIALLDGLMLGDGEKGGLQNGYFTSSRLLADDVQELGSLLGMPSTIHVQHTTSSFTGKPLDMYTVRFVRFSCGVWSSSKIERRQYRGMVYCVSVPNQTLLVRRGGKTMICGNCVWGYRDGMGDWFVYDEYWNNSQSAITADHIEEIAERSKGWGWAPNMTPFYRETYADPSRPGEINAFNRAGIVVMPGANDVFKGIDCVRSLLKVSPATGKPRLYIHSRCKHLIEEMRKYRWRKGKKPASGAMNPAAGKPIPLKRDDDTADAMRYLIYSTERGRGAVPGSGDVRTHAEPRHSIQARLRDRSGMRR